MLNALVNEDFMVSVSNELDASMRASTAEESLAFLVFASDILICVDGDYEVASEAPTV